LHGKGMYAHCTKCLGAQPTVHSLSSTPHCKLLDTVGSSSALKRGPVRCYYSSTHRTGSHEPVRDTAFLRILRAQDTSAQDSLTRLSCARAVRAAAHREPRAASPVPCASACARPALARARFLGTGVWNQGEQETCSDSTNLLGEHESNSSAQWARIR
jgi:hypothetical protein